MKRGLTVIAVLTVIAALAATGCVTQQPAAGWVNLFDGRTLNGWIQRGGQSKYSVRDSMIVGETVLNTPNSFLCTEREYGAFILEVEFQVDDDLNSGVQIRSQSLPGYKDGRVHGCQVEIDPSLKPYTGEPKNLLADGTPAPEGEPRAWTGGIYDEGRRGWLYDLSRNELARRAFRHGQWNHFRIEAIGDTIRTWINGVPAADLRDGLTPRGFIALQVHSGATAGLQVKFRNIRIHELAVGHLLDER